MSKCILIQANGDGIRMRNYFDIPKHNLYYKGDRIINHIYKYSKDSGIDTYLATKYTEDKRYNTIQLRDTNNRIETLSLCIEFLKAYQTIIVHDCDVLFNVDIVSSLDGDMLTITNYKKDGLKYGFVDVESDLTYKIGNEKKYATQFIASGLYSFNRENMLEYIMNTDITKHGSLLDYYNINKPKLYYHKEHTNLGDIVSYMDNL